MTEHVFDTGGIRVHGAGFDWRQDDDGQSSIGQSRTAAMIGSLLAVPMAGMAVALAARLIRPLTAFSPFAAVLRRAVLGAGCGGAAGICLLGPPTSATVGAGDGLGIMMAVAGPVLAARTLRELGARRRGLPPLVSHRLARWPAEHSAVSPR